MNPGDVDPRRGEAFALASGLFQANRLVTRFLREQVRRWAPVSRATTEAEAVFYGQFLRVESWMRSLDKLDDPADFQAVAAASRAMMEACIDMALLSGAPQDFAKMLPWEESAKLKHALNLERYLTAKSDKPTQAQQHVIDWAANHKARVDGLRVQFGWFDVKG